MRININSDAAVVFTNKLEKMAKSALPNAVRGTLNNAAFDVKKMTMPAEADKNFVHRKPTFFKANSKVDMAKGWDISAMQSAVGFVGKNKPDQAVEDLEQQEHGGAIKGRAFIPLAAARVSKSWLKNVRAGNRISVVKANIIDAENATGANDAQKFTKSAIHAGKGGLVIGTKRNNGNRIVFKINSTKRVGKNTVVNSTPVFSVRKGRAAKPKATHFMQTATEKSAMKLERFYGEQAKRQVDRLK